MTPGGWIIMLVSVGAFSSLFVYCVVRVLRDPQSPEETLHGFEVETPDLSEPSIAEGEATDKK